MQICCFIMYRKTLSAHNNLLLFFDTIKEVTLCYNKVSDVVSCITEYCFFVGGMIRVIERLKKVMPLTIILIA